MLLVRFPALHRLVISFLALLQIGEQEKELALQPLVLLREAKRRLPRLLGFGEIASQRHVELSCPIIIVAEEQPPQP